MRTVSLLLILNFASLPASSAFAAKARMRGPVVIAVSATGNRVYTANRSSGSVSIIDPIKRKTVREIEIGGRLSAMAMGPGEQQLLITDEKRHRLLLLARRGNAWRIASRIQVAAYPVDLAVAQDGRICYVSSLWSRAVTVVDLTKPNEPRVLETIRLPFEPRKLCLAMNDSRLIVADSFAGALAVIDTKRNKVIANKSVPGHNIRGLTLSADGGRLLMTLQSLNRLARSTLDDVHWGNMMVNVLYSFAVNDVCDPKADLLNDRRMTHLGGPENAAGDPGAIAVAKGRIAVALAGVHQVAVSRGLTDPLNRVSVGQRPTALALSKDGRRVFTADRFSDSVSIIDAVAGKRIATISLGPQPKLKPAELGERLFFDAKLSHDGWMSCHSCHTDGHTNGLLNDNLSDGSFGAPKRVLSLLGVSQTGPWAWKGHVTSLEEQTRNSITKTMRGKTPNDDQVAAIVAYLKTLKPPPPVARFDETKHDAAIAAGRKLFAKLNCNRCHSPPAYTSKRTYDVGLKDALDNRRYNPPSLLGVGRRRAYFHDGRATSLREVFQTHRHQLPRGVAKRELEELIAFLRSL